MKSARASQALRPPAFHYRGSAAKKKLYCERISLESVASLHDTPLYVYSAAMIRARLHAFARAFRSYPHTLCYSVKANSTLAILRLIASEDAGFDVVSGGELQRVLRISAKTASRVVFSGVGKTEREMELALHSKILLFNIESASELELLAATASRLKKIAAVAVRVNPDVSAKTHPYISTGLHQHKFGVPISEARSLYAEAAKERYLKVNGVSVHIGSQINNLGSFREAMEKVVDLVQGLRREGRDIQYIDAGGGLGIDYEGGHLSFEKQISAYAQAITKPLRGLNLHLLLEPGRSIVGPAGLLLTRVLFRKKNRSKRFLIVDAAMNDLLRPSLYGAHHEIVPVLLSPQRTTKELTDIVGPICETGDFFARDRRVATIEEGALLAILDTGAYGSVLGSNYNTRGRTAEVLVDGENVQLIRRRETFQDQIRTEK